MDEELCMESLNFHFKHQNCFDGSLYFSFINKCRTRGKKGGEVAAIFKSLFQCNELVFGHFGSLNFSVF